MVWLKGGWVQRETSQTGETSPEPTDWRFLRGWGLGPAQSKGAVVGRRRGRL